MLVSCLPVMDKFTGEVFYRLMQIANAIFSKMQPTEKASKPLRVCSDRSSRPIWKSIEANMLHNLPYVFAISSDLHNYDTDHNVPDIAIISKTEIWAICKIESTDAFLFEWDGRTDKNGK